MESAARMNPNKTEIPHLSFISSPNGDTIIIHHSFFIIHLCSIFFHAFVVSKICTAPAAPEPILKLAFVEAARAQIVPQIHGGVGAAKALHLKALGRFKALHVAAVDFPKHGGGQFGLLNQHMGRGDRMD